MSYTIGMVDELEKELRFREAKHLQALESNPLNAEDIAMFKMFEREGFTPKQQRAFILAQAKGEVVSVE